MNKVLWRPSAVRRENANITHFMTWVRNKYGIEVSEYNQLYQWSIENPADFWELFWQFANIKASKKGNVTLLHADKMPGAQWFPGTRLNYAENLLNHRNSHSSSIIFHGENGTTRHMSSAGIHQRVSQLAQALRNDSVKPGDRIAGVLPNIPEAIIAMLATACLGAIWTSCSPDFGIPAIVDRFKQIKPKVLFVSDGYYFNGKEFDRLNQIMPLVKALPSIKKTILIPYLNSEDLTVKSRHKGLVLHRMLNRKPANSTSSNRKSYKKTGGLQGGCLHGVNVPLSVESGFPLHCGQCILGGL